MADDLKQQAPEDSSRISTTEEWELRYWSQALSVTPERLKKLVRDHGNSAQKIRDVMKEQITRVNSED